MKDVFVVSSDQEYFNLFYDKLGHLPIHFSWSSNINEAMKYLPLEKPSFVFFVSKDIELLLDWIEIYNKKQLNIPFVCFTKQMDWKSREMIWKLGSIELIKLPINRKELEFILKALLLDFGNADLSSKGQIQGRLEEFNVIDLIQVCKDGKKNGLLIIQSSGRKGEIYFNKGKLVNARYLEYNPLEAVKIMSTWFKGQFTTKLDREKRREHIRLSNQQIILECLSHINLQDKLLKKLPAKDSVLYASPDLNYEEISSKDRESILLFKNGFTIDQFLESYAENSVSVIQKYEKWINMKWLVTQEEYQASLKKIQEYESMSGFQKIINKVFSKSNDEQEVEESSKNGDALVEEKMLQSLNKKSYLFKDSECIQSFLKVLEETE